MPLRCHRARRCPPASADPLRVFRRAQLQPPPPNGTPPPCEATCKTRYVTALYHRAAAAALRGRCTAVERPLAAAAAATAASRQMVTKPYTDLALPTFLPVACRQMGAALPCGSQLGQGACEEGLLGVWPTAGHPMRRGGAQSAEHAQTPSWHGVETHPRAPELLAALARTLVVPCPVSASRLAARPRKHVLNFPVTEQKKKIQLKILSIHRRLTH